MSNPLLNPAMAGLLEDNKEDWRVQQAANGLPYYYNTKTKKSQWEKPDSLKTPEERLNSTGWQELTTQDGKTFYYNAKLKQSIWKMPPELKAIREKQYQAELRKQMTGQGESGRPGGSKIDISFTSNIGVVSEDQKNEIPHEEAVRLFLSLLKEKANPLMKWEQVHNLLHEEERYKVIKSFGEKKKIFKDWVTQTKQQERNESRQKLERAKENFRQLLEEKGILTSDSKFYKVAHQFMNDPRWKALEDRDRENIFQDYLDYLYDKEKQEKRQKRKELSETVRNMLLSDPTVTSSTKWNEINQKYKNNDVWNELGEYDRLLVFSEYVIELDRKEYEEKRKMRRMQERKNREAFRDLLKEYIEKGKLVHKTKWSSFVQAIKDDPRFLNMLGQPGSTPRELFEDQIELLKEQHKRIKDDLKKALKEKNIVLNSEEDFNLFNESLKDNEIYKGIDQGTKRKYFEYFLNKARSKEKNTQKKHRKLIRKFTKYLKSLQNVTPESEFQNFENIIEENVEFSGLAKEEKQEILKNFVSSLKNEDEGQVTDEEKDRSKKKKAKKKRRAHRKDSGEEGYSSDASKGRSGSKSRSRSRSKDDRRKKKEKKRSTKKSESSEKESTKNKSEDRPTGKPSEIVTEPIKTSLEEQHPNIISAKEDSSKIKTEDRVVLETNPQKSLEEEDREEGEETKASIPRIINKSISKSSSVSRSKEKSRKKKDKRSSKKKSKKSEKKNKKKKKKRDSSPGESSDSEESS